MFVESYSEVRINFHQPKAVFDERLKACLAIGNHDTYHISEAAATYFAKISQKSQENTCNGFLFVKTPQVITFYSLLSSNLSSYFNDKMDIVRDLQTWSDSKQEPYWKCSVEVVWKNSNLECIYGCAQFDLKSLFAKK